ncbi:aminoglycoside phosphotransferase family protein [Nocardia gamkensis]|uniref:aminoglycoside phosphotransferase family protein n=1 Tax=Nocardia gamkensis TaxID=352869 RepID=UPI001FE169BA|nr:aminoglycoside phosphotransferase family protein [Nocardia gamkensis]
MSGLLVQVQDDVVGDAPVDGRAGIDAALVERLIRTQFPQWGDLLVAPVAVDGWDNRTYRLGSDMSVRLPTAAAYAPAVAKESIWLPRLAPMLPVAIPTVLAVGVAGYGYAYSWSVRDWLPGDTADRAVIGDMTEFAADVAQFIGALQRCDASGAPFAGAHSFYRGSHPAYYDEQTRRCLQVLSGRVDVRRATEVWESALVAEWNGTPVWFHGDIAAGNLLVADGKLTAVIDFGTCGVGDPACDLVLAWTLLSADSRATFRRVLAHDDATWARARGWALWKALLTLIEASDHDPDREIASFRVINEVLADDL